ncbi:MAG: type VI secretion system protein TssL, partial [Mesorhizobium sp.]
MSSKDDPSRPADKTVIRAPRSSSAGAEPAATPARESTVFDPGVGRRMPTGWSSGTVVVQNPVPED